MRVFLIALTLVMTTACDPDHKKECEWYLVPDTDRIGQADEGFIPVCARNFVVNKQDCRLQTTREFAEKVYQRRFRYNDLKIKNYGAPRTVEEIRFCDK